jgi:cytochrome c-type biogenesis protein CcmF
LLGAYWSYEELGWGGYWGWDPVENGSLIPWLTGTALIHSLMVWRYRGGLKRTALALAFATFGLCNFATFLTRSGIFSSLHAFSQSPIGWMFLVLMFVLVAAGTALIGFRRQSLVSTRRLRSLWARETLVVVSASLLLLLTAVIVAGTLALPLSTYLLGWQAVVGPEFYNAVLVPIGLLLLATTAAVPLLRWGGPPTPVQKKMLLVSCAVGLVAVVVAFAFGVRHPVSLVVAMMSAITVVSFAAALLIDARRRSPEKFGTGVVRAWLHNRRQYCGYLIHLGFICVAIGVTGSSLATRRHETVMKEGQTLDWAGRRIRYARLIQRELPDKLVAEAELEISSGGQPYTLLPARHFHLLQEQWTTEVAIHSTWGSDFYTILNSGEGGGVVSLTFVENPLMRWLWFGGCVISVGALTSLWPARGRKAKRSGVTMDVHKLVPHTEANKRRAA